MIYDIDSCLYIECTLPILNNALAIRPTEGDQIFAPVSFAKCEHSVGSKIASHLMLDPEVRGIILIGWLVCIRFNGNSTVLHRSNVPANVVILLQY